MIVGDRSSFAIESGITQAYEPRSLRGLGFFVIHVGGRRYGVYSPDSTMLACSFDEVENRICARGTHTAHFSADLDAGEIADAACNAIYGDNAHDTLRGIPLVEFRAIINLNHIVWAPDGDEAFDDGSNVLQFDVNDRVRLIAFKRANADVHDPATLSDVWLVADEFYNVLQQWHDGFLAEWEAMAKLRVP